MHKYLCDYMAMTGSTIFSHIFPVILGFMGVLLIASGIMDNKKANLVLGVILFVLGCILPFIILSMLL